MKHQEKQWNITGFMGLMVFFLFALCLLLVLLTGARIYRSTVQAGSTCFDTRTVAQYLTTRLHQSDCRDQVTVETFSGTDALVFREEIGGSGYLTMVYCYGGSLRELFCTETGSFSPGDGELLFPLQDLSLEKQGDVILAELTLPEGEHLFLTIQLRSEQEVIP